MIASYKKLFEQLDLSCVFDEFEIFDENILSSPNRIHVLKQSYRKNKKPQLILADSNPHAMHDLTMLLNDAKQTGLPVKILTGNLLELFNNDADLIYFPTCYLSQQHKTNYQSKEKKFRFSFLTSQARFHRLYLYHRCKNHITDDDCFAVHVTNIQKQLGFIKSQMSNYLTAQVDILLDTPFISPSARDEYQEIFKHTPASGGDHTNRHPAYSAMINITGESNIDSDQVFVTEKTWKAIQSQCLIMTLGNDKTVSTLSRLGFELPKEVDPELPLLEKIEFVVDRMKLWNFEDCSTLYKKHVDAVNHNYDHYRSQGLKTVFANQIKEKLTSR